MQQLKSVIGLQLHPKTQRHLAFDGSRAKFEYNEGNPHRELSLKFREILVLMAKYMIAYEDNLNASISGKFEKSPAENVDAGLNCIVDIYVSKLSQLLPNLQNLLDLVEEPTLLEYIEGNEWETSFNLQDCLKRLDTEAIYLLKLSENINKLQEPVEPQNIVSRDRIKPKLFRSFSLDEREFNRIQFTNRIQWKQAIKHSLQTDLNSTCNNCDLLNFKIRKLTNLLLQSENDRRKLQEEVQQSISKTRSNTFGEDLQTLHIYMPQFNSHNHTDYAKVYGMHGTKESSENISECSKALTNFVQLQEQARNVLAMAVQQQSGDDDILLQLIEDFCREGDKLIETNKRDYDDLQLQVEVADKQLRATRQFLEEQAYEREEERDDYLREIHELKAILRGKENKFNNFEKASDEMENLESKICDLTQQLHESIGKREKFEMELKASIDKIFVLREIVAELEVQLETKALDEHAASEKIKQLEEFITTQTHCNNALQLEVENLKTEIAEGYKMRLQILEDKLQNIRPSMLEQIIELLCDIEIKLDQKVKTLESVHFSVSSNSCSISATEDISIHGNLYIHSLRSAIISSPEGAPVHLFPRQYSVIMENMHRIIEKLAKHSRMEEAAIKRIRDLELQLAKAKIVCTELQHERHSVQKQMSEQTQHMSVLQAHVDKQRKRGEELQRLGTSDLNIRIHDLQTELQNMRDTLSAREKQVITMKLQLEKSQEINAQLETELVIAQQPNRCLLQELHAAVQQKDIAIQKLKDKIKLAMINKQSLPDLMGTILADKNEEIDYLKEKLNTRQREQQFAPNINWNPALSTTDCKSVMKDDESTKLSGRTLSDIVSINNFEDVHMRRVVPPKLDSLLLPIEYHDKTEYQMIDISSKQAVTNVTPMCNEDIAGLLPLHLSNTFEHPHYFQNLILLHGSNDSGPTVTTGLKPRQINFSVCTYDSNLKTPIMREIALQTPNNNQATDIRRLYEEIAKFKADLEALSIANEEIVIEKEQQVFIITDQLTVTKTHLVTIQAELMQRQKDIEELQQFCKDYKVLEYKLVEKSSDIERLLTVCEKLQHEKTELLIKAEKNTFNHQESENNYLKRIAELEQEVLKSVATHAQEKDKLLQEMQCLTKVRADYKSLQSDITLRKQEVEQLNEDIKIKDEHLHMLSTKYILSEDNVSSLQWKLQNLEQDMEELHQQQLICDNSSKQCSMDEIALQVLEHELHYSAQLHPNILKAIESEEENNLDLKFLNQDKRIITDTQTHTHTRRHTHTHTEHQGTDVENLASERELINQLEALRKDINVEREENKKMYKELLLEKQQSQEIQEHDVVIISAMRKRLENALENEHVLHKQLDMERDRCERIQTQLISILCAESNRNFSLLPKPPLGSPRRTMRSLKDVNSDLVERFRKEIKLLTMQNERVCQRYNDVRRNSEREGQCYAMELQERGEYCEKLKNEIHYLLRERDAILLESEHMQQGLMLQTNEIESLQSPLVTPKAVETHRRLCREQHFQENTSLIVEVRKLRRHLVAAEAERERLNKIITSTSNDLEQSKQRESELAKETLAKVAGLVNTVESSIPQHLLQKIKEINILMAKNTVANCQMAKAIHFMVEKRYLLQTKRNELESCVSGMVNMKELEQRYNHLLVRYLRVKSHRKALVYQKRYLKLIVQGYQKSEQVALVAVHGRNVPQAPNSKKRFFKTIALVIVAIHRMRYVGYTCYIGKRILPKSIFSITQAK